MAFRRVIAFETICKRADARDHDEENRVQGFTPELIRVDRCERIRRARRGRLIKLARQHKERSGS